MGELKTGRGLHQEVGISRACNTRWGSHFKSFNCFILKFGTIMDILDNIVETAHSMDERSGATGYIRIAQTYEIAFMLHSMKEVLGITNDLSTCLQKKEQDIANVMLLVKVAKRRLQELRENERWDLFVVEVSVFCIKYNIVVPDFDEPYNIMRMAELYPDDFDELSMCALENQLANYIIDVCDIDKRFSRFTWAL
ncbi:hypothetical protein H5410_024231 [Solanum commersonii]|uniref:Uncharacterized protein n=1 Tax=Solanum commersonii TaxID=4109 RepID=A0A9J5ZLG6_SOLCO|nr:hypothetical protein H5410_024231 [Solanum commersonii]